MTTKQKPNLTIRLPDELQKYLLHKATENYRTVTAEITMRLERSRVLDTKPEPGVHSGSTNG